MKNKKLKIIFIINTLSVGGTEKQLVELIKKIKDQFEIKLFAFRSGELLSTLKKCGIDVTVAKGNSLIFDFFQLAKFILYNNTDIYHFLLPKSYIIGSLLTFLSSKKKILSRRSLNNYHKKYSNISKIIERQLHKKVERIIVNTEIIKNQLIKDEFVESSKIIKIKNFIPPLITPKKIKTKNKSFIYVANFIPYKGHLDLIEICSFLMNIRGWKLYLVGEDRNGHLKSIKKKIKELGLQDRIVITGLVQNVEVLYSKMDFAISTSTEEGSSNFLLEAITNKLPIIAYDVGGNRDFFNKKNGFLIKPFDKIHFCKKIKYFLQCKNLKDFSDQSFFHLTKEFNNDQSLKKYLRCYKM